MNEENTVESKEDIEKDSTTADSSKLTNTEKESTADQTETTDYSELVEQVTNINQKLDNLTNVSLVCMVGLGLVVGIVACNIFSKYFHS